MRKFLKILSTLLLGISSCLLGISFAILDYRNDGDVVIIVLIAFILFFLGFSFMDWDQERRVKNSEKDY